MELTKLTKDDLALLSAEFPEEQIGVKIQSLSKDKTRALLVLYLSHTTVAARLDSVDPGWSFEAVGESTFEGIYYVRGRLTMKGVYRENFGEGENPKSACSDALKRCAMLLGVGRSLYDQTPVWTAYSDRDRFRAWTMEDYQKASETKPGASVSPIKPPSQPEWGTTGAQALGTYVIGFGKYKGKRFQDVGAGEMDNYIEYLERSATQEGKPMGKGAQELITQWGAYKKTLPHSGGDEKEPGEDAWASGTEDLPF